jgi:hypothetical protein
MFEPHSQALGQVIAIRRPVMLCPQCMVISRDLDARACGACETELLTRVPLASDAPQVAARVQRPAAVG